MKAAWIVFMLLGAAMPTGAQAVYRPSVIQRIGHYISTHKELLASDAVVLAAWSADAASSVHCQAVSARHLGGGCVDSNGLLGPHPSKGATWGYALGASGAIVTLDHLLWHWSVDDPDPNWRNFRHFIWLGTAAFGITETMTIRNNVNIAEDIQNDRLLKQARQRLSQP